MKTTNRLLPYGFLALIGSFYFLPVILGRHYFWGDVMSYFFPYVHFGADALRHMSLPLWNRFTFSGMPFLADVQSQLFYPTNWVLAALPVRDVRLFYWSMELLMIIHLIAGGCFLHLFLHELQLRRMPALLGATVYMFSGFTVTHLMFVNLSQAYTWLPLLLFLFYRTLSRRSLPSAVLAGLVMGLVNLAGHPQTTLHFLYVILVALVGFLVVKWRVERGYLFCRHIPAAAIVLTIGFGVAAVAFVPALENLRYTGRQSMAYADSVFGSLSPYFPVLLFVPKFFGSVAGACQAPLAPFGMAHMTDTVPFWLDQSLCYWETCLYVGILPLALAVLGAVCGRGRVKYFFLLLGGLALLAALGRHTPVYGLLFRLMPGFDLFRIPARLLGVFTLSVSVLAAMGLQASAQLGTAARRRLRYVLAGVLLLAVAAGALLLTGRLRGLSSELQDVRYHASAVRQYAIFLVFLLLTAGFLWSRSAADRWHGSAGRVRQWLLPATAVLISVVDLYVFGHSFNLGAMSPSDYYATTDMVQQLQEDSRHELFRINGRASDRLAFKRNQGLIHRLELIEGYTPLQLADYALFNIPWDRRCDLLNVKYRTFWDEATQDLTLQFNPTYLPRAWLVYDYVVEPEHGRVLDILAREDFDYRGQVVLERDPPADGDMRRSEPQADSTSENTVAVTKVEANQMVLRVQTDRPGLLVLSEVFYPKWRVKIDGRPARILRADYCLRAVAVGPGVHEVLFYYDAGSVRLGAFISLVTLVAAVTLLLVIRKSPKDRLVQTADCAVHTGSGGAKPDSSYEECQGHVRGRSDQPD